MRLNIRGTWLGELRHSARSMHGVSNCGTPVAFPHWRLKPLDEIQRRMHDRITPRYLVLTKYKATTNNFRLSWLIHFHFCTIRGCVPANHYIHRGIFIGPLPYYKTKSKTEYNRLLCCPHRVAQYVHTFDGQLKGITRKINSADHG